MQKTFEHILTEQRTELVEEIYPHILDCVKSSNANHVVQVCLYIVETSA